MRALEKDRNRRYESASAFAADVQRFLNDEPVLACPPSVGYRFRKFARRKKGVLTAVLAVAIALCAGTTISLWQAVEAKAATKLADERLDNESEARRLADASFKKALEAVDRMLSQVGDDKLSAIPQMKELRDRLLRDAADFYTELIALNPHDGSAYCERGLIYDRLEEFHKVLRDYEKAVELDPDNEEFRYALAGWLLWSLAPGEGDLQGALYHAKRASELADLHGNVPQPYRPRFRAGDCAQPARSHLVLGCAYKALGQTNDAVAAFRKAAASAPPESADAHYCLTFAETDPRAKLAHWQKAHELAPSVPWYLVGMADLHHELGEDDEALVVIEKGLKMPTMSSYQRSALHKSRATIYMARGDYERALLDYNNGLTLCANEPYLYKRRALVHFKLGLYEKALADVGKGLELKPDDVSNLMWIPHCYVAACPDASFRTGVVALADQNIAALRGKPGSPHGSEAQAYTARASLYAAMKQYDKAQVDIEKAIALGVSWNVARQVLLEVYTGLGRPSDALPGLESFLAFCKDKDGVDHPDTLETMQVLGYNFWRAKKIRQGDRYLRGVSEAPIEETRHGSYRHAQQHGQPCCQLP